MIIPTGVAPDDVSIQNRRETGPDPGSHFMVNFVWGRMPPSTRRRYYPIGDSIRDHLGYQADFRRSKPSANFAPMKTASLIGPR